jgi:hypothetical protein
VGCFNSFVDVLQLVSGNSRLDIVLCAELQALRGDEYAEIKRETPLTAFKSGAVPSKSPTTVMFRKTKALHPE